MLLLDFLDKNKIPYLKFSMKFKGKGKKDCGDGVVAGYQNFTYEEAMLWNTMRSKQKNKKAPDTLNVILKNQPFMVIDIDDKKVADDLLVKYGDNFTTKSCTKNLPHIWRKMDKKDNNTTNTLKDKYDLIYHNIFEKIDSVIEDATDIKSMPVFSEWEHSTKSNKPTKAELKGLARHQKPDSKPSKPLSSENKLKYNELLDMIPTDKIDYDIWMKIVFACHNINDNLKLSALNWSKTSPKYQENPEEFNIAWNYCVDSDTACKLGTLTYYAMKFNETKYKSWVDKHTANTVNPDDLSAEFLREFDEDNLVYTDQKLLYIFINNKWILDKDLNILKHTIRTLAKAKFQLKINEAHNKVNEGPKDPQSLQLFYASLTALRNELEKVKRKKIIDDTAQYVIQLLCSKKTEVDFQTVIFDVNEEQHYNLHFKNGVLELDNNMNFRPRVHSDYVSKFLNWDYNKNVDESILNEIKLDFKKIQPNCHQRKFLLQHMAYSLCGNTRRNMIKFNIGSVASNGKSTLPEIHMLCFPLYSEVLESDYFKKGNTKRHKTSISLLQNPVRFAYVEEIDEKTLDDSFMKNVLCGKISVEVLFGTTISGYIQAKFTVLGNETPVLKSDNGILRRGIQQDFDSHFNENLSPDFEDDWENKIFYGNNNYKTKYESDDYKNGYLQILLQHYDLEFQVPKINKEAFSQTLELGNTDNEIIDEFEVGLPTDFISNKIVKSLFPTKSFRNIVTVLRRKFGKDCYFPNKKINGVKGQFNKIKIKIDIENSSNN
tara:strand:+ start:208 stop:2523 length:2316 start_codon:yes stop_codon:yes gene_type:complete